MQARFRTWRELALALGMTESGLMRGVNRGSLDLVNLLTLAELTETPPLDVLRIAGKADLATLIERRFGTGAAALSGDEHRLLEQWSSLDPEDRLVVQGVLEYLVALRLRARAQQRGQGVPGSASRKTNAQNG